jgi:hypothetical protein
LTLNPGVVPRPWGSVAFGVLCAGPASWPDWARPSAVNGGLGVPWIIPTTLASV